MPLRPIATKSRNGRVTNKKYSGVLERYRASDGKTTGYYLSYRDVDSKSCKHAIEAKDRDDALLQLNQVKAQIKRDKLRKEARRSIFYVYSVSELAVEFFESKKSNANYKKEMQRFQNHIEESVGHIKTTKLIPQNVEDLQAVLTAKGLAPKTINLATDLLRAIMRYGLSNNLISRDCYTLDLYNKLQVDNLVDRTFKPDEIRELIKGIEQPRLKLFISMAYYTAQRPESLLRLQVKDIIDDEETGDKKIAIKAIKHQKSHEIKVHAELLPLLDNWIKDLSDEDFIFYGLAGKDKPLWYTSIQREAVKLFAPYNRKLYYKAGMTSKQEEEARKIAYKAQRKKWVSLYTLRHSAATNILASTGSLESAGAVLNHSDSRITQRYAKTRNEKKSEAVDAL